MSAEPTMVVAKQGLTQMGSSLMDYSNSENGVISIEILMILIGFLGIVFIGGYILMAYIIITGSQVLRGSRNTHQNPTDIFRNKPIEQQLNKITAPIVSATESLQQQQQYSPPQPASSDRKYVVQTRS